jgi:2-C-methyl-D-erythritol 4-phosphate cytidylyltransferase
VPQVWAVVVAGGSGQRFGQLKQFALLDGRPVLQWTVEACRPVVTGIVLVLPAESLDGVSHGADVVVEGGPTRSDSVRLGLAAVPPDADIILIHDAARPLASPALFTTVIAAITIEGADAAIPGLPVSDTIKRVDEMHNVIATDDAALVEALGATVRVVPGDPRNLKITTPDDLRLAEHLLVVGD